MSQQPMGGMEITSDDKLWALLAYIFSPLVPIIILLMEDKKSRRSSAPTTCRLSSWV